jgi:hypothetical protein
MMPKKQIIVAALAGLMMLGCAEQYQTHSDIGANAEKPNITVIQNKNGSLSLYLKGSAYYGNLVFDASKRFELNPLIKGIDGNAKGYLVSKEGKTITCVMQLMEETKSGTGYCLEDDNPKLLKFNVVNMD